MKKSSLYYIWLGVFVLCFGLSLIPTPSSALSVVLKILSVGFFVPPAVLLFQAKQNKDTKTVNWVRLISGLSLGLTLVALIANIASTAGSETLGNVLYVILIWVSSPMICSGYWALSLFLWAFLFCGTFLLRKPKN